ncbi:zf-HC2 domain-containing protein [Streptomyces sp. HNM0574]|uniref:anti-sigma factor family protein n=1 Tax=Streptomyces sp. HNM0574 TaxID=2714954 RepID=UPI00146D5641|nr:zf-HC2 domain-containing protein [Streptomyces sp. HNM0574]NLU69524.1 hypothetical protein [Streptomyces sp. HNM0574]
MTPTPFTPDPSSPTDEHPEVAELSALTEGLLPPERATDVRAHLADCPLCADVRDSLDEIRDALGTLPGPVRMPEDIAGRIDAALAAEALLDAAPPAAVSRETGTASDTTERVDATDPSDAAALPEPEDRTDEAEPEPARPAPDTPVPVSRETGATRGAGRPRAHTPATGPGRQTGPRRRSRKRLGLLVGACVAALLGVGGIVVQAVTTTAPAPVAERPPGPGEDEALQRRVQALVTDGQPATGASPKVDTRRSPGNSPLSGDATTVPSCVREGTGREETPIAAEDDVRVDDRTGYLVVYPHAGGSGDRVDAYLVDASCVSGDASGPGDVLLHRTYPRG